MKHSFKMIGNVSSINDFGNMYTIN